MLLVLCSNSNQNVTIRLNINLICLDLDSFQLMEISTKNTGVNWYRIKSLSLMEQCRVLRHT